MAIDPKVFSDNDKRLPAVVTAGDVGKVVTVDSAGGYVLSTPAVVGLTGEIKMWILDTPPAGGWLTCGDGIEYAAATYPALAALLPESSPGMFLTPAVPFAKNSVGVNTLDAVAESVGTHGHTAEAVPDHDHDVTIASVGNHSHSVQQMAITTSFKYWEAGSQSAVKNNGVNTGQGGAHNHAASSVDAGGHTPVVEDHTGVNQPAHMLLHFIIKT